MTPNRRPAARWSLRRDLKDYVRTIEDEGILIRLHWNWNEMDEETVCVIDRRTARLLARRINQCLDATVKR